MQCSQVGCVTTTTAVGLCKKHYNAKYFASKKGEPSYRKVRNSALKRWRTKPENREKELKRHRKYYKLNRQRLLEQAYAGLLRRAYGISKIEYDAMLRRQKGRCNICKRDFSGRTGRRQLCVDHCHRSGKVRALLCHRCNLMLGVLEGSNTWIAKARAYLRRHAP